MVKVGEDKNNQAISVKQGEVVEVSLPGNPTTGYRWTVQSTSTIRATAEDYAPDNCDPGCCGSGGVFNFKFQVSANGSIVLGYVRPWETNTPPVKTFTLNVTVA